GAAARRSGRHQSQLDQYLSQRIGVELYLRRLLVAGYDAVYEIGRDFRNEGVSYKHNPEFTQIEFYKAYIDYNGVMDLTERLLRYVVQQVTGGTVIEYQGHTVDFGPEWPRIRLRDAIRQHTGIDYMDYPDAASLEQAIRDI